MFLIGAALLVGTAALFAILGSTQVQKWNMITDDKASEEEEKNKLSSETLWKYAANN